MKFAVLNGTMGVCLSVLIGTQVLNLSPTDVGWGVLVSNLGVLAAFLLTLQTERKSWIKKNFLQGNIRTWSFFALIYLSLTIALCPFLQEPKPFFFLIYPLFMSGTFSFFIFGPVQDRIVWRSQKPPTPKIQLVSSKKRFIS